MFHILCGKILRLLMHSSACSIRLTLLYRVVFHRSRFTTIRKGIFLIHLAHKASLGLAFLTIASLAATPVSAQSITAQYAANYSLFNLSSVPGVPVPYGGLTLEAGNPNTLLIGGNSDDSPGVIYSIGVTRNANRHITGFSGTASLFATAPDIDAGLTFAPNGDLLYTNPRTNQIGEIKPGSTSPDKFISASEVSGLQLVPHGFGGAGNVAYISYNSGVYYTTPLLLDGSGTYDLGTPTAQTGITTGLEGFAFVPIGSPDFAPNSILVSEFGRGNGGSYALNASGVPASALSQFIAGLDGAQGAFTDPLTGDVLFSTFGKTNEIVEVRGFAPPAVPEASTTASFGLLLALGLGRLVIVAKRKKVSAP